MRDQGRIVAVVRVIGIISKRTGKKKWRIVNETLDRNGKVRRRKTLKDNIATEAAAQAQAGKLALLL